MKYNDIKSLSRVELQKKRAGLLQDIFDCRVKNKIGQLSNPLQIRKMRRDIARIETVLTLKSVNR